MSIDIVLVLFSCVCANHLGLVGAIEGVIGHKLPIVNCPKCLSFWSTLSYCILNNTSIVHSLAIALLIAYLAIWLELMMGFVDTLYLKVYEKVYSTRYKDNKNPSNANGDNSKGSMSYLRRKSTKASNKDKRREESK